MRAPSPVRRPLRQGDQHRASRLAVGAVAAWCGTVFLVSEEANQPDLQKQRILDAAAEQTIVTRLYSGKTMRNITNPLIEAWERQPIDALPMGCASHLDSRPHLLDPQGRPR